MHRQIAGFSPRRKFYEEKCLSRATAEVNSGNTRSERVSDQALIASSRFGYARIYQPNSRMASSARTPPVMVIGTNGAFAAIVLNGRGKNEPTEAAPQDRTHAHRA